MIGYLLRRFTLEEIIARLDQTRIDLSPPVATEPISAPRPEPLPEDVWRLASASRPHQDSSLAELYSAYWRELLEELRTRFPEWKTKSERDVSELWLPSGRSGFAFRIGFPWEGGLRVQFAINVRSEDRKAEAFRRLRGRRAAIEKAFGEELAFQAPAPWVRGRVATDRSGSIVNQGEWREYRAWMLDALERLRDAITPALSKL